jgi:putative ABC transport system permease protein
VAAAKDLLQKVMTAIRMTAGVTLLIGALVLAGAVAASQQRRKYQAVLYKTLGATRGRLITAYMIEYGLLGAATALFGMACGSLAAWMIVTELMNLRFTWLPGPALAATLGALIVTVALGLIGTLRALGQKPAPVLRNL